MTPLGSSSANRHGGCLPQPSDKRRLERPAVGFVACALRGQQGLTAVVFLLAAACGYVGDPMPPALRIPVTVTDLAAVERGEQLIVQFTGPATTTEGLPIDGYDGIDLRIGTEGVQPFDRATWEAHAERLDIAPPTGTGLIRIPTPAARWAGREVIIGLRLAGPRGLWSDWSNLVAVSVVEPVPAPRDVEATSAPQGVELRWAVSGREGLRYRVFRRLADAETRAEVAETSDNVWIDSEAAFGTSYEYRVQALAPANGRFAESDLSEPVAITPEDRFPPSPPENLRASVGFDTIELTWDRVAGGDVAYYRVYRAAATGQETRIANNVTAPSYSDRDITEGEQYRYRVTAVDTLGNESGYSSAVEQTAPRKRNP